MQQKLSTPTSAAASPRYIVRSAYATGKLSIGFPETWCPVPTTSTNIALMIGQRKLEPIDYQGSRRLRRPGQLNIPQQQTLSAPVGRSNMRHLDVIQSPRQLARPGPGES